MFVYCYHIIHNAIIQNVTIVLKTFDYYIETHMVVSL